MSLTPPDPWTQLRQLTAARIALGRAGSGQRTAVHLAFQLAHAQARDAVHQVADLDRVASGLTEAGITVCRASSAATDRTTYLQRPDLGRQLAEGSGEQLASLASEGGVDLAIVIADGLSGSAVDRHAVPLALLVHRTLNAEGWRSGPVTLVAQGRVAVGDAVGAVLGARLVLVLIGERPGLSSPDSLGAYLTWAPRPGRTDAERNCVSNIRPEGLAIAAAAQRICWLLREARRRGVSGVALKEAMPTDMIGSGPGPRALTGE